jgi:hypothetical protein
MLTIKTQSLGLFVSSSLRLFITGPAGLGSSLCASRALQLWNSENPDGLYLAERTGDGLIFCTFKQL